MATVTRSSLINGMSQELGIAQAREVTPSTLRPDIQAVYEIGSKYTQIVKAGSATATGDLNLLTTPRDKDFYVTYASFSVTKDVTSDLISAGIVCYINGLITTLLIVKMQTVTAGSFQLGLSFPYPIKVDRNTVISVAGSFAAGTCVKNGIVGGFVLE